MLSGLRPQFAAAKLHLIFQTSKLFLDFLFFTPNSLQFATPRAPQPLSERLLPINPLHENCLPKPPILQGWGFLANISWGKDFIHV
jgi:hypothetical protein